MARCVWIQSPWPRDLDGDSNKLNWIKSSIQSHYLEYPTSVSVCLFVFLSFHWRSSNTRAFFNHWTLCYQFLGEVGPMDIYLLSRTVVTLLDRSQYCSHDIYLYKIGAISFRSLPVIITSAMSSALLRFAPGSPFDLRISVRKRKGRVGTT